jgi:hypothetical protein
MVTIHALPENVLLEIFKFYVDEASDFDDFPEDGWHTLVHVCQRWRFVVFASPHRLDLQILCTNQSKVEKKLDIWPQLPIALDMFFDTLRPPVLTNITAALRHHHRVSRINICDVPNFVLKEFGAMKNPFPALTELTLESDAPYPQVLPDSFLLGSAPRLQTLTLRGISFPALPKLLLSTGDLVELHLDRAAPSGYVSPEALAASLSMLPRLKKLSLLDQSPPSWDDIPRPPRFTRGVLPSLTYFEFNGHSQYLERLVSRIEGPLLDDAWIKFSDQLAFDAPQLRHFFSRTETFKAPHRADIQFTKDNVSVALFWRNGIIDQKKLRLIIPCSRTSWQISAITHVCSSPLPPLPTLQRLGIYEYEAWKPEWQDNTMNTQWLQLFQPFSSVKNLFLSKKLVQLVAPALQELAGGRVTDVLPALQNLFLHDPEPSEAVKGAIGQFIAERQLSDCPVAVHCERGSFW